jgi:hypothetical protein
MKRKMRIKVVVGGKKKNQKSWNEDEKNKNERLAESMP